MWMFCAIFILALVSPTRAVMSGDADRSSATHDPDYAAGLAAFTRADWPGVIAHMANVVLRRPWRDDAYGLMGYASRKLGHYRDALAYYQKALDLNPHNLSVLEYLGQAYVEIGCIKQSHEVLARLEVVCKRLTRDTSAANWRLNCTEWQELQAAIDAATASARPDCAE
jgi:tetratricopeptide (TPR) repeat protein